MAYLNTLKISQNTGLILNLQNEINDLSGSVINYQPQIDDLSASILVLDGQVASISSAVNIISDELDDVQQDVIDLSSEIITLTNEVDSNTAQITLNTGAISIIGGEIDTLEINVEDLSSQVLDLSTNTAKLNADNTFTGNNTFTNYITTPKVEITTEPVDLSDATTKNYVDNAIAGVNDTSFARIDTINTFAEIQTFLKDIKAEEIDATKYKINDGTNEYVYGEYSNTYYVNDNEGGISGSINDVLALLTQGQLLKVSAGSYADEDVLVEKTNIGISAPIVGGRTITEIGTTGVSRTLTIDNSERIRMDGFQINGLTTINGTLHKHYFSNMSFNGGLTIDGGVGDFMIFKDCEINIGLTINATFGGVIYFYRVNFQNQPLTCNQSSPLQVVMVDCAEIPDDASLFAGNYFATGVTSFYKSGSLTIADLNPAYYVRDTSPSQDNELASKFYVDLGVNTNASAIATNALNISTNTSNISTLQGLVSTNTSAITTNINDIATNTSAISTNTTDIATNTSAISTNTTDIATNTSTNTSDIANTSAISTNTTDIATNTSAIATTNTSDIATKQDTLIAGTGIEIVGATISATGGGGGSSIEIFQASMVRDNGTTALSNNDNLPFAIIDKETSGLTMSASNGEVTFGGSNVAGAYEIKYSLVLTNTASTTNRVIVRGYVNNVWVVEFGKLSGFLENGAFTYDFVDGDVLRFSIIGLQGSNQLLLATGLTSETYASCFLTGIKLI